MSTYHETHPLAALPALLADLKFTGRIHLDPLHGIWIMEFTMPAVRVQVVPSPALGTAAVADGAALGVYCHIHADDSVYIGQGPLGSRPAGSNAKHYGDALGVTVMASRVGAQPFTADEATFLEASLIEGARRARLPRRNTHFARAARLDAAQADRLEMTLISTLLLTLVQSVMPRREDEPSNRQVDQMIGIVEDADTPMTQSAIVAEMARRGWPVGTSPTAIVARNLRDYVVPSPLSTIEETDLGLPGRTFYVVKGRQYSPEAIERAREAALGRATDDATAVDATNDVVEVGEAA